jgi:two-component system, NtrC family, nitrogen regulation sensor histidine kinase NtrY
MISRNLYFNIIVRVLVLMLLSLLLSYFALVNPSLRLSIIIIVLLLIATYNLIFYLNATNRKIRFFFDSVRNDDSTLTFPAGTKEKSLRELYESMQKVNLQIQQLRIDNRNQEQYFQILIEHLGAGIISFDDKGFILHANSAVKKLLSLEVLTHLKQLERIDAGLYEAISEIHSGEKKLIGMMTPGGEIQVSLKATSLKIKDSKFIILSLQDIKSELDEKELDSWMKLIRVLMHEIMNSITPITSLSESLSRIYVQNNLHVKPEEITEKTIETTVHGLDVIREQGKGLMSFVESYRKLTRIPEPVKKSFRLTELFDRIKLLYSSLENSGETILDIEVPADEVELNADQNLISQVLINLLKNAVEANENNPVAKIVLKASVNEGLATEICVSDNGPGISEEVIDKIFIPFFTTRRNGSGIGLSLSKQIMKAHGGTLKVRSIPNKETTFCLSF